jgi:uracil-DNA glycosylase
MAEKLVSLLKEVRACRVCEPELPLGARPVVQAGVGARLLIIGQAPGRRVHETGIPWNDPSGDRLRAWLGMDRETFYDPEKVAIIPMGFCYPGKGKSGDLPPRKECAPLWHARLFAALPNIHLTLLIGQYAQNHYLPEKAGLADNVANYARYLPRYFPLPHPSPRNIAWFKHHPWFADKVLPALAQEVALAMAEKR